MANELMTIAKCGPKPLPRSMCAAPGCNSVAHHPHSGLCAKHDRRRRRTGSTELTRRHAGAGTITTNGYLALSVGGMKKQAHVAIAESAIGKQLPAGAEVHHVNGIRHDNRSCNLVVCPSRAYHKLLHQRTAAYEACGFANYRKCPFCKGYDDPINMTASKYGRHYYHAKCKTAYGRARRAA